MIGRRYRTGWVVSLTLAGPWKACHERLRRWTADGTWDRILTQVQAHDDAVGTIEWAVSVDSAIARAHQHAAGARKRGAAARGRLRGSAAGHCDDPAAG